MLQRAASNVSDKAKSHKPKVGDFELNVKSPVFHAYNLISWYQKSEFVHKKETKIGFKEYNYFLVIFVSELNKITIVAPKKWDSMLQKWLWH